MHQAVHKCLQRGTLHCSEVCVCGWGGGGMGGKCDAVKPELMEGSMRTSMCQVCRARCEPHVPLLLELHWRRLQACMGDAFMGAAIPCKSRRTHVQQLHHKNVIIQGLKRNFALPAHAAVACRSRGGAAAAIPADRPRQRALHHPKNATACQPTHRRGRMAIHLAWLAGRRSCAPPQPLSL